MAKKVMLLLLVVLAIALSMSLAGATACPPTSKNPGGTPPNCGHAPPPPPPGHTCSGVGDFLIVPANPNGDEKGPLSGPIHNNLEGPLGPLGPTVHTANCDVIVPIGL